MAHSSRDHAKHLDEAQVSLVSRSRHPELRDVDKESLGALEKDLREHRDAARRRPEAGTGAEPADGRSARRRAEILTQAVKRVSRERGRRDRHLARSDLREFAADVVGDAMDKKAPKRGSAKGFAKAANKKEQGEEHPPTGPLHAGRAASKAK